MKKSNKIVAVLLALVMIISAVPMMTVSADVGGFGDAIFGKDEDKHEHVYVIQSVEEGSCTEVAKTTFKCGCGDVQVLTTGEPAHTPAIGGYKKVDEKLHSNYCTECKKVFEEPHKEFEYVVYEECVAPTCEKAGKLVYKCSRCNAKRTETIEPSVHIPSGKVVSDANKHGFTCVACEKLINEEHVWDEGYVDGTIKCGDNGKIIYTCQVYGCGKTKEVTVPAACSYPDKEDIEYGFEAKVDKFDEKGHTFECEYCGKDKVEAHEFVVSYTYDVEVIDAKMMRMAEPVAEPVAEEPSTEKPSEEPSTEKPSEEPSTEHKHKWSDWEVVKQPTCAKDGSQSRKCTECGAVDSKVLPATGDHSYEWVVIAEPTLESAGRERLQCTECHHVAEDHYIVMTLNTPTCQEEGEILVECKYCNYYYTATVDTVDHKIAEDAKCTKYTKDKHKTTCEYCGEVKVPHTWGDWKTTEPATTEKEGTKTRTCTGCGETETAKINKLTAQPGDVNGNGSVEALDARIVLQYVAQIRNFTDKEKEIADMNNDGEITAYDARLILQVVAGLK